MLDADSIIMVIGVGGAGGNAVNHMQQMGIHGVNFVVCNTDEAALNNSPVQNKIVLGPGRGAGNKPEIGRKYAIESEDKLRSLLETSGVKMLFIAAGMGGGTGTGASPVIANIAHDLGILTVAVVTMPFRMEGPKRYQYATEGIEELHKWVDSLLIIDNERLRKLYGKLPIKDAFGKADDVLGMATKGIAELITVEYALVRVDFADVETVMRGSGRAHMSVVSASGDNRALQVAEGALSSSLLDDNRITGAKEILLSFSVSNIDLLTTEEISIAMDYIQSQASYIDDDGNTHAANIIWGASEKESLENDELELVVVATRFADGNKLNIKTSYQPAEDPFAKVATPEKEKEEEPIKEFKKPSPPKPPVTISAPQDKYRQISIQLTSPAYSRRGTEFEDESEAYTRTIFQQATREVADEYDNNSSNGSLF
jgi:cell division protein FtsZ